MKFTVLLCTYAKDNPAHLEECLDSLISQTILPSEILIVKDGPLPIELDGVIKSFPFEVQIISLSAHQTLGLARAEGVKAATHDIIALMDSDDIALPNRFELQLAELAKNPKIDILGGQIAEFNDNPAHAHAVRKVPLAHKDIAKLAKRRNPFNAMTVMFRKQAALEVGNFWYFPGFEDYDLWVRMIKNGAKCQNCEDILVYARTGSGMYSRRHGLNYIRHEWRMQRQLRSLNFIGKWRFMINIAARIPVRLLPKKLLEQVYIRLLRSRRQGAVEEA